MTGPNGIPIGSLDGMVYMYRSDEGDSPAVIFKLHEKLDDTADFHNVIGLTYW